MTGEPLSLRGAKRRSNPAVEGIHPGLLRSARNDGRTIVIARSEATKQSSRGGRSPWIASLRSQRRAD
ncbi:MAG: hypothetical protein LBT00_13585 [Spirochaetaceae bacterium]|nr:hypothetical protein [Spirochaetaceae bacterium]